MSDDKIIQLPGTERDMVPMHVASDIEAISVINESVGEELKIALVLGRTHEDDFYFASTTPDIGKILILLERAKRDIIDSLE